MEPDISYLAALHSIGKLDANTMKRAVSTLMDEGFYSTECVDALDSDPPTVDEVLPAFLAALAHRAVPVPAQELAIRQLIKHHLRRIASPISDPWENLCNLAEDVFQEMELYAQSSKYMGDSYGIESLVGIYWAIDDRAEEEGLPRASYRPDVHAVSVIREAAQLWLDDNSETIGSP